MTGQNSLPLPEIDAADLIGNARESVHFLAGLQVPESKRPIEAPESKRSVLGRKHRIDAPLTLQSLRDLPVSGPDSDNGVVLVSGGELLAVVGYRQTQTGELQLLTAAVFLAVQQIHVDQCAASDQRIPAIVCKRDAVEPIGGTSADGQYLPTFNARCHVGGYLSDQRMMMFSCRRPQFGECWLAEALKLLTRGALIVHIRMAKLFNPFVDRRRAVGDRDANGVTAAITPRINKNFT